MLVLLSLLRFFLYHNLRSIIFLAFSLFTTFCNHSRSVNSIALPFSLPFAQIKTYCYLAETSVSFSNFRTAEQGFVLLSSCWLVLQNNNVVGLWTISGLGQMRKPCSLPLSFQYPDQFNACIAAALLRSDVWERTAGVLTRSPSPQVTNKVTPRPINC